jgi:hypothetical protein
MEMEKSYYVVSPKPEYGRLLRSIAGAEALADSGGATDPMVIAITQGGFGQDVVDDERQVKERFLERLFSVEGIDLPRSADVFDHYFVLNSAGELIDLDEEL